MDWGKHMKYNKNFIKEEAVKLYLGGKNLSEISKLTGWSRNYLGNLIKDDERIKEYRNQKTVKLYKQKKQNRINVPISTEFWGKIGISNNCDIPDFVDIKVDEKEQIIIIKKH